MVRAMRRLKRSVLISLIPGPEIAVAVAVGESTTFVSALAGGLGPNACRSPVLVRASGDRFTCSCAPIHVWCRPDAADSHFVFAPARFSTDVEENTLSAAVWQSLFPSDVREQPSILVPLLGRIIWKRLVHERKIDRDAPIVGIDVETREYRVFVDMVDGLKWARSLGKPTVYFSEYEPGAWRIGLWEAREHER